MGKVFGIIALICGILGIFNGWLVGFSSAYRTFLLFIPFREYILPGIAIVAGIIGIIVDDRKGMAAVGLVLGIFGILMVYFFSLVNRFGF